jgi:hypothetical protein
MSSVRLGHTRNVAGVKLTKISNAVYEQQLPKGKRRWFVRFQKEGSAKHNHWITRGGLWAYTMPFVDTPRQVSTKRFELLTDAVLTANKKKK